MAIQSILSAPVTYFETHVLKSLTSVQKRVALVAVAILSSLTLALIAYRHCFKKGDNQRPAIDTRIPSKEVEHKAAPTSLSSIRDDGHTYLYLGEEEVEHGGFIKDEIYREAVKNLTIVCVDTFVFNPIERTYLLVLRRDPPAQGVWWLPGGRKKKGEFAADASVRLCKREVGLDVTVRRVFTAVETIFRDSMWGCQTDTVNFLVFATVNEQSKLKIDQTCEKCQWISIDSPPNDKDPYVRLAYDYALEVINQNLV